MIVKLLYLVLVVVIVAVDNGFALDKILERKIDNNSMPNNCSEIPKKRVMKECCSPLKIRIWGNLKPSFSICKNFQTIPNKNEMASNLPTEVNDNGNKKQNLSEKINQIFKKIYNVAKKAINNLKDNVVMIPDHFHGTKNEECLMECVFENSGFLIDKKVNKDALLEKLKETLKNNHEWLQVAVSAVEKCHLTLSSISTNSECTSGAAAILQCIYKYIFFNCPSWLQNDDYCNDLKRFYQQCPDAPPPLIEKNPKEIKIEEDFYESFT